MDNTETNQTPSRSQEQKGHTMAIINDPSKRGQSASPSTTFGDYSRYAVFAVHTRFSEVTWFVTDAETVDPVTDSPAVIRQEDTREAAIAGL